MSNGGRIITYLLAFVAFCVAAVLSRTNRADLSITFVSLGLALLALVPLWDAIELET